MTRAELEAIASGGESEQVEFKRSTGQRTEAAKTICAMLNGRGGFVLFGVSDDGVMVGQELGGRTLEDITRELRRIEPQPPLSPEAVLLDSGRSVIVISIPGTTGGTYTYDGRAYIRRASTTSVMGQEEYRRRILEQMHPAHRWENQPAHDVGIDDLDQSEITRTIDEAIRRQRMEEPGTRDPATLLLGLGLMRNGQLLNAAVPLFARPDRLLPFYPQCLVRMARFRGLDKTEFEDNRQEHGNVFALLQRAQRFLRDHLPVAGRIVPNLFERADDPLYPPEALREALANAFCHRDYAVVGGSVGVAIYDDRLEISSTGPLRFGLTPEDLRRPHTSQPWNPIIANVLYRRGVIEQWGRGTIKMAELIHAAGLVPPEFEERGGELIVRFFPTGYVPPSRVSHDVSPLQQELLQVLAATGPASLGVIIEQLSRHVPRETVRDNLQTLRRLDLIELRGQRRWARWMLRGTHSDAPDAGQHT